MDMTRGQRVAINPMMTCLQCQACRAGNPNLCAHRDLLGLGKAGGYAEYVVAPNRNLMTLPDSLSYDHAALMEPLAVSVHAVRLAERALNRPISESIGRIGVSPKRCSRLTHRRNCRNPPLVIGFDAAR